MGHVENNSLEMNNNKVKGYETQFSYCPDIAKNSELMNSCTFCEL